MFKVVGFILCVQGGGGLINNLFAGSESWFLLNHLGLSTPLTIIGNVLLLIAGVALLVWREPRHDKGEG
ncbi:hypothetical protein [Thermostaphylospora chromogena]|uniref:Uncharacterized protein n=1 Tax=Thermostaphylospora chromogena TaxID=35622 RepID=A0A1H1AV41_9ACTN|nr:hypothetical protein [Thermostaphylospora chromogena]SDQ43547.1 hypothetical protein SAMN04489764_0667 [Thermostaphylospora chromogena]